MLSMVGRFADQLEGLAGCLKPVGALNAGFPKRVGEEVMVFGAKAGHCLASLALVRRQRLLQPDEIDVNPCKVSGCHSALG